MSEIDETLNELEEELLGDTVAYGGESSAVSYCEKSAPGSPKTKKLQTHRDRNRLLSYCDDIIGGGGLSDDNNNRGSPICKTALCWTLLNIDIPLYRNKRFQRSVLVGTSLILAFIGYLGLLYEFIEYDPPLTAWVPGIVGLIGLVSMNLIHFPDPNGPGANFSMDTTYADGRMSIAELYFVLAIATTILPVVVSLFIMLVEYSHQTEHSVALALFFQTTCLAIASFSLMGARSMHITPSKKDDNIFTPSF